MTIEEIVIFMINIVRILIKLNISYAQQHTFSKVNPALQVNYL